MTTMLRQITTLSRTMMTMCAKVPASTSSITSEGMKVSRQHNENTMSTQAHARKMDVGKRSDGGSTEDKHIDVKPSTAIGHSTVYTDASSNTLYFNFEDVPSSSLQREVIDDLMKTMLASTGYQFVTLNHVNENVYRYNLQYLMRRLGYKGSFTRYNRETGMANYVINLHST